MTDDDDALKKFRFLRKDLRRGDLVVATEHLDPDFADVAKGTPGVVFQEWGFHEVNSGPMVRFVTGGCCNVYEDQVKRVDFQSTLPQRQFEKERYKTLYLASVTGKKWAVTVLGPFEEETRYEELLSGAFGFVHDMATNHGLTLERLEEHFKDPSSRGFFYHIVNDKKEGDGYDRSLLFQRLR